MAHDALPFIRWAISAARLSWFCFKGLGVILLRGMIVTLLYIAKKHRNKAL